MNPFQALLFVIFFLPMMMIKEGLSMFSEFFEGINKKKFFWRLPYYLLAILSFIAIVLWIEGYR